LALIGITCESDHTGSTTWLHDSYYRAVEKVGGTPILLPPLYPGPAMERLLPVLDGLLLSGGGDVDPCYFGEEPLPNTGLITPDRDLFEITLTRRALAKGIPIFGICRGMQVLNIAAGGDIYQDLALSGEVSRVKHCQSAPRWHPTHEIIIRSESLTADILESRQIRVNSFHHQILRKLAPGLKATAWARDGVIEAVEGTGQGFVLGVQFHPESMCCRQPVFLNLFEALNRAAVQRRLSDVDETVAKIIQGKPAAQVE